VSSGSRIEDCTMWDGGWGLVSVFVGVYSIIVVYTDHPKLSRLWLPSLVTLHVIFVHSFLFVSRPFGATILTVVGLGDCIPMGPAVAALIYEQFAPVDDRLFVFFVIVFCRDQVAELFSEFLQLFGSHAISMLL
jgi:hypothetical protein